jgi:transcriptional regulator with XRE-family HTH domain
MKKRVKSVKSNAGRKLGPPRGRLGGVLRAARLKRKLSVEDVAQRAGVPAQSWYGWELGNCAPRYARLGPIARALGISAERLTG